MTIQIEHKTLRVFFEAERATREVRDAYEATEGALSVALLAVVSAANRAYLSPEALEAINEIASELQTLLTTAEALVRMSRPLAAQASAASDKAHDDPEKWDDVTQDEPPARDTERVLELDGAAE